MPFPKLPSSLWWPFVSPASLSVNSIAASSDVNFSSPPPLSTGATVSATMGEAPFLAAAVLPGVVLWPAVEAVLVRLTPVRGRGGVLVAAVPGVVFFTVSLGTLVPKPTPPVLAVPVAGRWLSEAEILLLTASLAVLVPLVARLAVVLARLAVVPVRLVLVLALVTVEVRLVAVPAGRVLSVLGRVLNVLGRVGLAAGLASVVLASVGLVGDVGVFFSSVVRAVVVRDVVGVVRVGVDIAFGLGGVLVAPVAVVAEALLEGEVAR